MVTGVAQVDLAVLQVWVVVVVAAAVAADLTMMTTKTKIKSGKTGSLGGREGTREWLVSRNFELIRYSFFSGLSIENPDRQNAVPGGNMVRDLLRRAAQ